jgi:ferredoxin
MEFGKQKPEKNYVGAFVPIGADTKGEQLKMSVPAYVKSTSFDGPKNKPLYYSQPSERSSVSADFDKPMKVAASVGYDSGFKKSEPATTMTPKDSVELPIGSCIHCGRCVDACPMSLVPTAFLQAMDIENVDERMAFLDEHSVTLCMSCGCCSFVCPANRPLTENIRMSKNLLKDHKALKASLK